MCWSSVARIGISHSPAMFYLTYLSIQKVQAVWRGTPCLSLEVKSWRVLGLIVLWREGSWVMLLGREGSWVMVLEHETMP